MSLNVILASTPCGIIGVDGDLPWKLRSDLIHFKGITEGHPIIMGRKTYESLPGVLPNRLHIVVTSNPDNVDVKGNAVAVPTLGDAISFAQMHAGEDGDFFITGGSSLYQLVLDTLAESKVSIGSVYWTRVNATQEDFDGDITRVDVSYLEDNLNINLHGNYDHAHLDAQCVDVGKDKFNQYDFKIVKFTKKEK